MEIQMLNKAFPFNVVERYWISMPENNNTACGWPNYPAASNCQFLQELIARVQNTFHVPVSILSNGDSWYKIFKDYQGCPEVSSSLLWWVPNTSNQQPNFDDFMKFGGWYTPYAKLYTSRNICGVAIL